MKVYIVYYFNDDYDTKEISVVMTDLDKANDYAKRSMSDDWRVQDGYPYETKIRSDGKTMLYKMTDDNGYSWGYYVGAYEVDNEA